MIFLPLVLVATSPIQIDGSFDDWPDAITHQEDEHFIYTRLELPSVACLQQLPEQKVMNVGEYTIFFSPKNKGYGVSCKKGDHWISPYEAGIVFAPTTASSSFEIRVNKPLAKLPTTPFSFEKQGDIRVLSWNVQFGNLLDDTERSARILKALQPDVLLFQELDGDDTDTLGQFLISVLDGPWTVGYSMSTGTERHHRLISAIATRFNAVDSSVRPLSYSKNKPLKAVVCGTKTESGGATFVSLHLRCCGGPTGEAEIERQEQATKIRLVLDSITSHSFIIAGDWNLVGTMKPLEIVKSDEFAIVNAYQPDGILNATWSDTTSSFTPGRLDWMLYSPKTLEVAHSFVLDTNDLDSDTLLANDLLATDTAALSDHLPLIADFKFLK